MDSATYSLQRNAKAAALKIIAKGVAPATDFEIVAAGDGRFAIEWGKLSTPAEAPGAEAASGGRGCHPPTTKGAMIISPDQELDHGADAPTPKPRDRLTTVIELLKRAEGATIGEIQAATGWLPHTTRAFIAVQVKRRAGREITTEKVEGRGRVYRVAA